MHYICTKKILIHICIYIRTTKMIKVYKEERYRNRYQKLIKVKQILITNINSLEEHNYNVTM